MASYLSLCQEFSLLSTILSTIALTYVRSSVISSCFKLHSIHIFETKVKSIEFPRTTWNVQTSFFCFHSLLCLLVIELRLLTRSMNFLFKKKASIIYTIYIFKWKFYCSNQWFKKYVVSKNYGILIHDETPHFNKRATRLRWFVVQNRRRISFGASSGILSIASDRRVYVPGKSPVAARGRL